METNDRTEGTEGKPKRNPSKKQRVWVCIQRSNPDGSMASWGDASWELHLSPLKSVGLALNIGVLVKEAKRLQKAEDMLGRRRKPAGEPVFKPTPKFPGKR